MADEQVPPQDPPDGVTGPLGGPQPPEPKGVVVAFPGSNIPAPPQAVTASPAKPTKKELRDIRAARRAFVYEMRMTRSLPFIEIGRLCGVSGKTAWYDYEAYCHALGQKQPATAEARRQFYVAQMEQVKRRAWDIVDRAKDEKAKVEALRTVILATERQVRLGGEDMPTKVASTTPDGKQWAPLAVEELRATYTLPELRVLERAAQQRLRLPVAEGILVNE